MKLVELIESTMSAEDAYHYALEDIKGRWPEGEAIIATSHKWAYEYAKNIIKDRFPEGEAVIAASPTWSVVYANEVIKGRFPEGESRIANSPNWSVAYASNVMSKWPEGDTEFPKKLLIDERFIIDYPTKYETFVKGYFKDNTILINKWLRYAKNVRDMK
jgi:hypothetical protein